MLQSIGAQLGSPSTSPQLSSTVSTPPQGADLSDSTALPARLRHAARLEKLSRMAQEVLARGKPEDVGSLTVADAKKRLGSLNSIRALASLSEFRISATFGGKTTTSAETLQSWIEARAGGATEPPEPSPDEAAPTTDDPYIANLERIAARFAKISQAYAQSRDPNTSDVGAMSPEQAQARLDQLTAMKRIGALQGMGVSAVFGQERTESMDVYMSWLGKRAGETAPTAPPSTSLDITV
jgi:hypothetical protein